MHDAIESIPSSRSSRPMWLNRPEEIAAHLAWAAAEAGTIQLDVDGETRRGRLTDTDPDVGLVWFEPSRGAGTVRDVAPVGRTVRARYRAGDAAYSFLSEVTGADGPDAWWLVLPRVIERDDRRIVPRYDVWGDVRFAVEVQAGVNARAVLPLVDVAPAGAGIAFDPAVHRFEPGARILARLSVPDLEPVPVVLEIRNARPFPGDTNLRIAGCRFAGMRAADQRRLASALVAWRREMRAAG